MRYLIKKAKVISKGAAENGKRMDILVQNGTIVEVGKNISDTKAKEISSKNLHVSIGWMDIGTHIGEPGYEHRETTKSLCRAALAGGYTDLAPFATSSPTLQTRAQVTALIADGKQHGVQLHPIGALSIDRKGDNIAEYMDMAAAGAVAYSDGLRSVQKTGLLLRALQYAKSCDGLVIHHPTDHALDNGAQVHEGATSVKMGIKGSPSMAEHILVERDLHLQEYAESPLCLHAISSKESIDKIKKAKKKSDGLYATVGYLNLLYSDVDMLGFDTNLKVKPVLRQPSDKTALLKGVQSGAIDCIVSNHVPLETEAKQVEFPYATSGATGLETVYAALSTHLAEQLDIYDFIQSVTVNPRKMLGIEIPTIAAGQTAKLTCWDPTIRWTYSAQTRASKSDNSPWLGQEFTGRVVACFNESFSITNQQF